MMDLCVNDLRQTNFQKGNFNQMKKIIFLLAVLPFALSTKAQTNKGLCNVEVNDFIPVVSFGYLVSYDLNIINNSNKIVTAIDWTAYFYGQDGSLVKTVSDSFSSSCRINIDPKSAGHNRNIIRTPRVKGAVKMTVTITKVVFHDGSVCK